MARPKKPVPTEANPDHELVAKVEKWIKSAELTVSKYQERAKKCMNFYVGRQWDEADKKRLAKQGRPHITMNRIAAYVNAVIGTELSLRQDIRFVARNPDEQERAQLSELSTDTYQWAIDMCNGNEERSQCFKDTAITGMGFRECRIDIETDIDGAFVMKRVPWNEMGWDPFSQEQNLEDARWMYRRRWVHKDDIRAMWPEKAAELVSDELTGKDPRFESAGTTRIIRKSPKEYTGTDQVSQVPPALSAHFDDMRLLTEVQWWERETIWRVASPTEEDPERVITLTDDDHTKTQARMKALGEEVISAKQYRRVYKRAVLCGKTVLEKGPNVIPDGFSWLVVTGDWDAEDNCYYGIVSNLLDPQRGANAWFSQGVHVWNTSPKGALVVEENSVTNPQGLEERWAKPGSVIWMKEGVVTSKRYEVLSPPGFSDAASAMTQFALDSLGPIIGIDLATYMGKQKAEAEPGVTHRQRIQQAQTIMAPLFYALLRSRKTEARTVMSFVRNHLADDRLIRVGGIYNAKVIPLAKDPLSYQYDLMVDDSPSTPQLKQATWEMLQPLMPVMLRAGTFPPDLLDISPLPAVVKEKVKKFLEQTQQAAAQQQAPQDPEKSPEMMAAKLAKMQAETKMIMVRAEALQRESQVDAAVKATELAQRSRETDVAEQDSERSHEREMGKQALEREQIPGTGMDTDGYNDRYLNPKWPGTRA